MFRKKKTTEKNSAMLKHSAMLKRLQKRQSYPTGYVFHGISRAEEIKLSEFVSENIDIFRKIYSSSIVKNDNPNKDTYFVGYLSAFQQLMGLRNLIPEDYTEYDEQLQNEIDREVMINNKPYD
jgi:hypothetical protein